MGLARTSVRRPVTTIMVYLGVILVGIISWQRLPQELFPPISYPQLTVVTVYENAAPEEIESLITKIIEEGVSTVSGLKRLSSVSKEGISLVTAEFGWQQNMDFASLAVRENLDIIKERLPRDAKEPVVVKYNPFELPVMILSVSGQPRPVRLLEVTKRLLKEEIEKTEGVAAAAISGGIEREIAIDLDQGRLQASQVPINDVVEALASANLNYPAGTIKEAFYEFLIRTIGEFQKVPEIEEVAVKVDEPPTPLEAQFGRKRAGPQLHPEQSKRLVKLRDIATIRDTIKERSSFSRYNGEENVTIAVQKQAEANTLKVVERVTHTMARLEEDLDREGITVHVVYDQSRAIREAIRGVVEAGLQGGVLAFLVLLLVLRDWWSAFIVTTAIPISVIGTLFLMHLSGLTLNMMSLGGLALGVGMLVDAGVVVVENIFRLTQQGMGQEDAAIQGTEEVTGAVTSSVLTTVAVFLPMVFVVGIAGQVFKELALTVTYSLMMSLVVSVTLVPVLAGRFRVRSPVVRVAPAAAIRAAGVLRMVDRWSRRAQGRFQESVARALDHRVRLLVIGLLLFLGSAVWFGRLDREFLPRVDQGSFIMRLELPVGTRLERTDVVARRVEGVLAQLTDVQDVTVTVGSTKGDRRRELIETLGSHQAQIVVNLRPRRRRTTGQLVQVLKDRVDRLNLEGGRVEYLLQESAFQAGFQQVAPLVIQISGHDLARLERIALAVQEGLAVLRGVYSIKSSQSAASPETKVQVLKDRAAFYNLSVVSIAQTAQVAINGVVATKYKEGGDEIDVRVRLRQEDRKNFAKVRRIPVYSPLDLVIPLSEVAYLTQGTGPTEIKRVNQERVINVSANLAARPLSAVVGEVERLLAGVRSDLPDGYVVKLSGEQEQLQESFASLRFVLALSILAVYMLMAAQFESLWQPFIIMFTVPLSLIGVVLSLVVSGTPVSAVVLLGITVLGGIVVDNAIVLIDFANLLRAQGLRVRDALIQASITRLRPIIMTAGTTVVGLVPLALGLGTGAELQAPMAITVMGGLTVATVLTLGVVPAAYLWGEEWLQRFGLVQPAGVVGPSGPPSPLTAALVAPSPLPMAGPAGPTPAAPLPHVAAPAAPEEGLYPRQEAALREFRAGRRLTRVEYARTFQVSIPTAARDLKDLQDRGLIEARGPLGPGRWYQAAGSGPGGAA